MIIHGRIYKSHNHISTYILMPIEANFITCLNQFIHVQPMSVWFYIEELLLNLKLILNKFLHIQIMFGKIN